MDQFIKIANREWVMGLRWRSSANAPTLAELQAMALEMDADYVGIRLTPDVKQVGLLQLPPDKSLPKRPFSLAAAIADSKEQPWLGIFKLDGGRWWYIAVREGQSILPDGDVVGTYEQVMAVREEHAWHDDWSFVEGDLADLREIIQRQRRGTKGVLVQRLKPPSLIFPITVGIILVLAIGGGIYTWNSYETMQAELQKAALAAGIEAAQEKEAAISPLIKMPMPDEWIQECAEVIEAQPVSYAGWNIGEISCDFGGVAVKWDRGEGATVNFRPAGGVALSGDSIIEHLSLASLIPGPDNGAGLHASESSLYAILQPIQAKVTLSAIDMGQGLPGSRPDPNSKIPPNPSQTVNVILPFTPTGLRFDDVPGLRFQSLTINEDGVWTLNGVIYGR